MPAIDFRCVFLGSDMIIGKEYSMTELMGLAISLRDLCNSSPKVGAVIAKQGRLLSTGFRFEIEGKHAERVAIEKLTPDQLSGSTLLTTLEPCVRISSEQPEDSCTDLIVESKIREVMIGILDPGGRIYCEGYKKLLASKVIVNFFPANLRESLESSTFAHGDKTECFGPQGSLWVGVINSGREVELFFSQTDKRSVKLTWSTLQFQHGVVDLIGPNASLRHAKGANKFADVSDPFVFRDPSHFARMQVGNIAVYLPPNGTFLTLIKLKKLTPKDIEFQWQVRDLDKAVIAMSED